MNENKKLIHIANQVLICLARLHETRYVEIFNQLRNFASQLNEIDSNSRKLGKALSKQCYLAAGKYKSRIARTLNDLSYLISRNKQLLDVPEGKVPKLSMLVAELQQLQADCGQIDYDKNNNAVSIVTSSIDLDDVYLGPFKIELHLNKLPELYKESPYLVIALEPNPAATDESVTHPHVSNERLCEGDGSVAIRTALEQGRLTDFFTMIKSILNTYNPDSPYIALSDWDGTPCYDCGYNCNRDNCYYCSFCDRDYCEECSSYCRICEETLCLGCGGQCPHCEELVCPNCISECKECEEICCKECLTENLCPNCLEERDDNEESERTEEKQCQPQPAEQQVGVTS